MKILNLMICLFTMQITSAQLLTYNNLKDFIGNRIYEFEDFYKIKSTDIDDNFGNLTIEYKDVEIENSIYTIIIKTTGKNIKDIEISNAKQRTDFFKRIAIELEESVKSKKNYKTIYLSIVNNKNKRKIFYDDVNQLIDRLKETNLNENKGYIESEQLKANLTINQTNTILKIY